MNQQGGRFSPDMIVRAGEANLRSTACETTRNPSPLIPAKAGIHIRANKTGSGDKTGFPLARERAEAFSPLPVIRTTLVPVPKTSRILV
jgi:hypothetical protein